jgi:D-alanine-D-alanine ligase
MNKAVTKEVLAHHGVPVLDWVSVKSQAFKRDKSGTVATVLARLALPLIIKPAHLGSSIGIVIVNTAVELEQQLSVATRLDSEVVVEPALTDFTEYNVSVRSTADGLECSPIEEPKRDGPVLSFTDKYANGSKKSGGKRSGGGMDLLDRTVPADISAELAAIIIEHATTAYNACRLEGMLRIDFMYSGNHIYCTELNPIPGSLAFYLWEAAGYSFQEQITHDLENAQYRHEQNVAVEPYQTDIVKSFLG